MWHRKKSLMIITIRQVSVIGGVRIKVSTDLFVRVIWG